MADLAPTSLGSLLPAVELARSLTLQQAPNGLRYVAFGETRIADVDLDRIVQAVPAVLAPALNKRAFYFVPLALPAPLEQGGSPADDRATFVATAFTPQLAEEAICHRNVTLPQIAGEPDGEMEAVFISSRLLHDRFAVAFEFFINVGHAFAEAAGIPEPFTTLAWNQALADVRGETSQDAWEARAQALPPGSLADRTFIDDKARFDFFEAAYADALAIYQLSLAVDFDYSELREREYPLLAPNALAERLRLIARLFPPNPGYEFSIRYRRRA